MISILEYKKDKIETGSLQDIAHPKTFTWADVFEPNKQELKQLAEITRMNESELGITIEDSQRPKIIDIEGPYTLIIFGAPSFEEDQITTTPVFIYVSKYHNCVITIRNKDTKTISRIKGLIEARKDFFERGASYFVYRLLDEILKTYFNVLEDIENSIDKLEDDVLKNPGIEIVERIFKTKKTLIYFAKSLSANREVIASVEREYVKEIDRRTTRLFIALYNDTAQLIDMSSTYRDILTGTLDTYLSSTNNGLQQVMKTLTVGASFILIPTLIASVYGMNFRFMPELEWKYGYLFALGVMIFSVAGMYFFFRRKKWI